VFEITVTAHYAQAPQSCCDITVKRRKNYDSSFRIEK